jgi:hypothetical protein
LAISGDEEHLFLEMRNTKALPSFKKYKFLAFVGSFWEGDNN